jgi:hypothetical protein
MMMMMMMVRIYLLLLLAGVGHPPTVFAGAWIGSSYSKRIVNDARTPSQQQQQQYPPNSRFSVTATLDRNVIMAWPMRATSSSSSDDDDDAATEVPPSSQPNRARSSSSSSNTRRKRVVTPLLQQQQEWATSVGIRISPNFIMEYIPTSGWGWWVRKDNSRGTQLETGGQVVITVPSSIALTVDYSASSGSSSGQSNSATLVLPWYVTMAIRLCQLDMDEQQQNAGSSTTINYGPWIQSLPRQFDTPFHWTESSLSSLQYPSLQNSVERQRNTWQQYYQQYIQEADVNHSKKNRPIAYDQFVWGCECARSRAFAGSYAGPAFNPNIYAFTLLLVTMYVGTGLGTLEQAANGAGVVLAASILKGTKRYTTRLSFVFTF